MNHQNIKYTKKKNIHLKDSTSEIIMQNNFELTQLQFAIIVSSLSTKIHYLKGIIVLCEPFCFTSRANIAEVSGNRSLKGRGFIVELQCMRSSPT